MSSHDETLPTAGPSPPKDIPRELECFGGYRLLRVLGRGGMGVVYEAEQLSLKRRVALKMLNGIIDHEVLARFLAEAEMSAALQHSNIVHIYEVGQQEGVPYFGMEYVEGGTLAQRMEAGPLPPREAAALLIPVARAVHFAHTKHVVHRDLKPGNILLDPQAGPKVADFGIAKRLDDNAMLTVTGAVMGTPCYMAPEQASGASQEASPASDIYSLGVILYEMLIGRPPFLPKVGEKPVGWRVVHEDPIPITKIRRELSRDLEAICLLCLRKSQRERYATAEDLAADLLRYLDGEPVLAKPPSRYRRARAWVRRHPGAAAGRTAAVLAIGLGMLAASHWLLYVHPHMEYAADVEARSTGIDVFRPLTSEQAAHAGIYLKLTRQGLAGPILTVEAVNARGRPATARDLLQYDVLGNLLQANAGFTDPTARGREAVRVDVTYENGRPTSMTQWDRNHRKILSVDYRSTGDGGTMGAHTMRLRFMDERSFDFTTRSGASEADVELDPNGRTVAMRFYDSLGRRARNGDGLFGYFVKRDAEGHVIELTNIDENDRPMANRDGVFQLRADWNKHGDLERIRNCDAEGHPLAASNGVAAVGVEYDEARNRTALRRYDVDGKPKDAPGGMMNTYFAWASVEYQRDKLGQIKGFKVRAASEQSPPPIVDHAALEYDANGYVSSYETWAPDGKGVTRLTERHDAVGNKLEYHQEYLATKKWEWRRFSYDNRGNATLQEDLNASGAVEGRTKVDYQEDRPVRETYYDATGKLCRIGSGYSQMDSRYNEKKYLVEKRYTGFELPHSAAKTLVQGFDDLGRLEREAWLDDQGHLTNGPLRWAEHLRGFHGDGPLLVFDKFLDPEQHAARGPAGYSDAKFEFDSSGALVGEVREGIDAKKEGYATQRTRLDAAGRVVEETFWNTDGAKAWCRAGYHRRVVHQFTADDMPARTTFEDYEPSKFAYFRMQEEEGWAGKRRRWSRVTFEDAAGHPVYGPEPCLAIERHYDEEGREVLKIQTGCSLEDWGAPVWRTETKWGGKGEIEKWTEQAMDETGQPMEEGNAEWGARTEITCDEHGRRRRVILSGLPEYQVGYSRRETEFAEDGRMTALHYYYGNGAPARIETVIETIDADAQPSAAQFQMGDVLLSRNGEPVGGTLEMAEGKPFPGGWVEVRRDGKTVRIDGFHAGKMGVHLMDRVIPRPLDQY